MRRASRVFPWVLCVLTWIGGSAFAGLHRARLLHPLYYDPPDAKRQWMEFAFINELGSSHHRPPVATLLGSFDAPSLLTLGMGRSFDACLLYTSPSPRDATLSRMPSSA